MKRLIIAGGLLLVVAFAVLRLPSPVPSPTGSRADKPATRVAPLPAPSLAAHQFDVLLTRIEKLDAVTRDTRETGAKSVDALRVALEARMSTLEQRLDRIEAALAALAARPKDWTTTTTTTKSNAAASVARAPK